MKVTRRDLPETINKIAATFESYWNSSEFEYYSEGQKERLARALKAEKHFDANNAEVYTMDIAPYSYQQEILDKLEAERTVRGYTGNLVVAGTGTGKTVISALDYKCFCKKDSGKPHRLLFVAHREEILKQSLYTFRAVLKDANFGELFVGSYRLERMDGKSVLTYFNNRIAAGIRLSEAIDRKLLCPFQYFGVTDTVDLNTLKWSWGGYDTKELENLYSFSGAVADLRADLVVSSLLKYVTDIDEVKGLGFCVSISLTSRWNWALTVRWTSTAPIPVTNCWWRWIS